MIGSAADRIEIIRDVRRLQEVEPEWLGLFDRCTRVSPFQHPAWQLPWLGAFQPAELHVLTVRRQGQLAGLAPLFVYRDKLIFIGNGISDVQDVLAIDNAAAQTLVDQMRTSGSGRQLEDIPAGSPLLRGHEPVSSVCPVLDLSEPIPGKLSKSLRLQRRCLDGRMSLQSVTGSNAAEAVEHLLRLHALRWQSKGEPGVLGDPGVANFHRRAVPGLAEAALLHSFLLRIDDSVAGVLHGLQCRGTAYYYLSGFDPEWDRFSPGSLLIEHAIEQARAKGLQVFDFLRGAEPYKYRWGARDRLQFRIEG